MTEISATFNDLHADAVNETSRFLEHGVSIIDANFGDGYAKRNPALLGAFMQAAAAGLASTTLAKVVGESIEKVAESVERLAS